MAPPASVQPEAQTAAPLVSLQQREEGSDELEITPGFSGKIILIAIMNRMIPPEMLNAG